jgi:lipopolysaccharide/colanic/teichoic acid biosynthesis glycosyltransferase
MIIVGRRSSLLLLVGDIAAFAVALYATLALRYFTLPAPAALAPYLAPFAVLFALWISVFWGAGLYGKRLALFPSRMPDVLLWTQATNVVIAALFFFLIPAFGIAPKTILILYLVVSLALIYLWRLVLYPRISLPRGRERLTTVALGSEAEELRREVNENPRYGIELTLELPGDPHGGAGYQTVPFEDLYEEVFDRVPLSELEHAWFLKHVSMHDSVAYVLAKRAIDIVGGLLMGVITLLLVPFIYVANRIEGRGELFIAQERFGRSGKPIRVYKFRSMTKNLTASGEWLGESDNHVTKVGAFLRGTSLDEFPQFINILTGELSLIGPRSDIVGLGRRLKKELPYYEARYLVTPGITGWAQINQQYEPGHLSPQSVEETKVRLAYDFYYLKHRSLGLDLVIAAKTIKRMFFRLSSS